VILTIPYGTMPTEEQFARVWRKRTGDRELYTYDLRSVDGDSPDEQAAEHAGIPDHGTFREAKMYLYIHRLLMSAQFYASTDDAMLNLVEHFLSTFGIKWT
jgi:hypothetical protein